MYWDGLTVYFLFCWDLNPRARARSYHSLADLALIKTTNMAIDGKNQDPKARRILPTKWKAPALGGTVRAQTAEPLVCYTAVFSVVTQYSSWEETLRDDTKNGCVADYGAADKREISLRGRRKMENGEEKKCKSQKEEVSFPLSRTPLPFPLLQEPTPSLNRSMPDRQATLELGLQPWVSRFARDPLHS